MMAGWTEYTSCTLHQTMLIFLHSPLPISQRSPKNIHWALRMGKDSCSMQFPSTLLLWMPGCVWRCRRRKRIAHEAIERTPEVDAAFAAMPTDRAELQEAIDDLKREAAGIQCANPRVMQVRGSCCRGHRCRTGCARRMPLPPVHS